MKKFLQKEVSILNSIHDNYKGAMSSKASKEQLLASLGEIVKSVQQNLEKVEQKLNNEKDTKSKSNETYTALIERERLYFKATKEFLEVTCGVTLILISCRSATRTNSC